MEARLRNGPSSRRVFGRDITNLQRRSKAHSIHEKNSFVQEKHTIDFRQKSRSFEKHTPDWSDPIRDHESDAFSFMLRQQGCEKKEVLTHVTSEMRQILVDWLVDVHQSFELKEQTLQLALSYLNVYASKHDITKHEYQLVGIACLWIASKYEEIYPPRMSNYVQVTDSSYSHSELKQMEGKILQSLDFNLNHVTPLWILEATTDKWQKDHMNRFTKESLKSISMCKYLLQLSLFDNLGKQYDTKTLVLSSLMLSDAVLKVKTEKKTLEDKVSKDILMKCFKDMCLSLQNASRPNLKLKALKKKYLQQKYQSVSKLRIQAK